METKSFSKCLNYIDEVIMIDINAVNTIDELEYIHNFMAEHEGGVIIKILSCINLIIESYYFNNKETHFESLYRHLRRLIMEWLPNGKSSFDVDNDKDYW